MLSTEILINRFKEQTKQGGKQMIFSIVFLVIIVGMLLLSLWFVQEDNNFLQQELNIAEQAYEAQMKLMDKNRVGEVS